MIGENERITRKLVGMLIEVLHGDYSDTRDLAVIQLVMLGEKAVPYILSFLKKEADLESDFIKLHEIWRGLVKECNGYDTARDNLQAHEQRLKKQQESMERFLQYFKKKWGWKINSVWTSLYFDDIEKSPNLWGRKEAVDRALEALAIIGDPKVIPALRKFPVCVCTPRPSDRWIDVPLFEKVKETIDKIQSV